jgi:hypothetical protein
MRFRVPDWLRYEIQHKIEQLGDGIERLHVKDRINENPKAVVGVTLFSVLLLGVVLLSAGRETPARRYQGDKKAWFYDLNTGELFSASSKQTGPIEAPSGPLPNGGPAGLKAHVYSYVLDPNASEHFVGFLERPDPQADAKQLASDQSHFPEWARGRLIKRVDDETWVSPTSRRGRDIIQELTQPNDQGQTPIYHVPR